MRRLLAVTFFSAATALASDSPAPLFQPALPDDSLFLQGRHVYERNCAVCHGERGDGKGDMAKEMFPKPRPFNAGVFKYKSTPAGALPTNADLHKTIRHGIAGTSMPVFAALTEGEIKAVAEYLKSFSPRWKKAENHAPPVIVPDPPAWFDDETEFKRRALKGGETFATICAACHGDKGEGNGTAAPTLVDAWGNPSRPADLRKGALRGGAEHKDIQRALITGIDGTPMASFKDALAEEQRWEIVAFIQRLRQEYEQPRAGK